MDFKKLKDRLTQLDTASICDVSDRVRIMDPGIRPVNKGLKMVGIARTVQVKVDFLTVLKALHDAEEDEVLVIDAEGDKTALAGELFALEAQRKKLAGIVVDGGCRDVAGIRKIRFPLFAKYIIPVAGTASKIFSTQVEINCGGVSVSPGDIVYGDDDGIVVIHPEDVTEILETAENIQRIEDRVLEKMEEGTSLTDLLNFYDHFAKIDKGEDSKLIFTV